MHRHNTLAEIAYAAGFSSAGYLAKLYRQEFGETTSESFKFAARGV
ncbi:AraC family transcriptional regulator [Pelagibius sp. Alg239-R121]